jgi:zinc transporter
LDEGKTMKNNGLIFAFILDGNGGASKISWDEVKSWVSEQGPIWIHLDYKSDDARKWLLEQNNIDEIAVTSLLTEETRPRTTFIKDSILLALRGVNLNPASDPEDMVSIRIWINDSQIITTRNRSLSSASDIATSFESGKGPKTSGEFISELVSKLTMKMEETIEELEDRVSLLEEDVITAGTNALRNELSSIRREAIMLRRYLAPQREAMVRLYSEKVDWLSENARLHIRESTDKLIRYIEDLDSIKDRAFVTQEELVNKLTEQMNSRMYVLSLVAAIFLPLGFLTGLLGINVGGIPGAENKLGFVIFLLFIVVVALVQFIFFKKKSWL